MNSQGRMPRDKLASREAAQLVDECVSIRQTHRCVPTINHQSPLKAAYAYAACDPILTEPTPTPHLLSLEKVQEVLTFSLLSPGVP